MTVTIRIPGTEEGDHSSRYPGEDRGNPNTRGQRKAIFDRKMLTNIRIPDVTRGEDDCYVKESSWFPLTGMVSLSRPFPTLTRTHTQRHRSPPLCWGSLRKWFVWSCRSLAPTFWRYVAFVFFLLIFAFSCLFFSGASFDAFLAGFIIMSGARTLTSLCFDPIRWGCSAYYSGEARLVFQFQGLSWFLARSVLQSHVQNWCCRFAVDFM